MPVQNGVKVYLVTSYFVLQVRHVFITHRLHRRFLTHIKCVLSLAKYVYCSDQLSSSDTCTFNTNALDTMSTLTIVSTDTTHRLSLAVTNDKIPLSMLSH